MAVGTAALIISGIIAAAGAVTSSALQNKAQREAKEESKGLAMIARDDQLDQNLKDYKINLDNMALSKESLSLKKRELASTTAMNEKLMRKQQISTLGQSLNEMSKKDQNMSNFILSLYGKTGAR